MDDCQAAVTTFQNAGFDSGAIEIQKKTNAVTTFQNAGFDSTSFLNCCYGLCSLVYN